MLLQVLRETLNCKLPIEIYHFPDEMKDEKVRADLIAWGGVKVVEVSVGRPSGFDSKEKANGELTAGRRAVRTVLEDSWEPNRISGKSNGVSSSTRFQSRPLGADTRSSYTPRLYRYQNGRVYSNRIH